MNIDKNIPIPNAKIDTKTGQLMQMQVGDSVLITGTDLDKYRWRNIAKNLKERKGVRFCSRDLPEGLRIWRVE